MILNEVIEREELNHWIYHDHDHQQMHYIQLNSEDNTAKVVDLIEKKSLVIEKPRGFTMIVF